MVREKDGRQPPASLLERGFNGGGFTGIHDEGVAFVIGDQPDVVVAQGRDGNPMHRANSATSIGREHPENGRREDIHTGRGRRNISAGYIPLVSKSLTHAAAVQPHYTRPTCLLSSPTSTRHRRSASSWPTRRGRLRRCWRAVRAITASLSPPLRLPNRRRSRC